MAKAKSNEDEVSVVEESKHDLLISLMEKILKNPSNRKTQKKYHRASSDCESSDDEQEEDDDKVGYVSVSRDNALKLSLKKLEEQKKIGPPD